MRLAQEARLRERVRDNCSGLFAVWTHDFLRRKRCTYVRLALQTARSENSPNSVDSAGGPGCLPRCAPPKAVSVKGNRFFGRRIAGMQRIARKVFAVYARSKVSVMRAVSHLRKKTSEASRRSSGLADIKVVAEEACLLATPHTPASDSGADESGRGLTRPAPTQRTE
jgi:hypothetical protein